MADPAQQAPEVKQEHLAPVESQVHKDLEESLDQLDLLDLLVRVVTVERVDLVDQLDQQVHVGLQEQEEKLVPMEVLVAQVKTYYNII